MIIMFEAGEYNTNLIGCMEWMIGRRLLEHPLDFNSAVDPDLLLR